MGPVPEPPRCSRSLASYSSPMFISMDAPSSLPNNGSREQECSRARRKVSRFPEDFPTHVVELIFTRLTYVDLVRARSVSSYWNSVVSKYAKASLKEPVPFLLLPGVGQVSGISYDSGLRCLSIEEDRVYSLGPTPEKIKHSYCLGSSHGWLIFLGLTTAELFMFNPLTRSEVALPSPHEFFTAFPIPSKGGEHYSISMKGDFNNYIRIPSDHVEDIRRKLIRKVILSSDPAHGGGTFVVVAIYGFVSKILCCKGRKGPWGELLVPTKRGEPGVCHDIFCYDNRLYVLIFPPEVEMWDLVNNCPLGRLACRPLQMGRQPISDDRRRYLVKSGGDILLVVRFTTHVIRPRREVFPPWLDDIYSHKTQEFRVFKVGSREKVGSLGKRSLFIGGNHAISAAVEDEKNGFFKANSIYFVDDEFHRMSLPRGGRDMGVFNVDDGKIRPFYQSGRSLKFSPLCLWILPKAP